MQWIFYEIDSGWTIQSAFTGTYIGPEDEVRIGGLISAVPYVFKWNITTRTDGPLMCRYNIQFFHPESQIESGP
jgi:hypothetical protein